MSPVRRNVLRRIRNGVCLGVFAGRRLVKGLIRRFGQFPLKVFPAFVDLRFGIVQVDGFFFSSGSSFVGYLAAAASVTFAGPVADVAEAVSHPRGFRVYDNRYQREDQQGQREGDDNLEVAFGEGDDNLEEAYGEGEETEKETKDILSDLDKANESQYEEG